MKNDKDVIKLVNRLGAKFSRIELQGFLFRRITFELKYKDFKIVNRDPWYCLAKFLAYYIEEPIKK